MTATLRPYYLDGGQQTAGHVCPDRVAVSVLRLGVPHYTHSCTQQPTAQPRCNIHSAIHFFTHFYTLHIYACIHKISFLQVNCTWLQEAMWCYSLRRRIHVHIVLIFKILALSILWDDFVIWLSSRLFVPQSQNYLNYNIILFFLTLTYPTWMGLVCVSVSCFSPCSHPVGNVDPLRTDTVWQHLQHFYHAVKHL